MTRTIGLTGPTGAGKSTAAAEFRRLGAEIIDADQVARKIVQDPACLRELKEAFGVDIAPDGVLNRSLLADRAFLSPEKTALLNGITHPRIEKKILDQMEELSRAGVPAVLVDGAVLLESGFWGKLDVFVVVLADREIRIQRIMRRDGITREQAERRASAQKPDAYYRAYAAYEIDGGAELSSQQRQVQEIFRRIMEDT